MSEGVRVNRYGCAPEIGVKSVGEICTRISPFARMKYKHLLVPTYRTAVTTGFQEAYKVWRLQFSRLRGDETIREEGTLCGDVVIGLAWEFRARIEKKSVGPNLVDHTDTSQPQSLLFVLFSKFPPPEGFGMLGVTS